MYKKCVILLAFLVNTFGPLPQAMADDFSLPVPGVMVHLSPEFNPPTLKGIKVYPDNPFRFDFILDQGSKFKAGENLKEESTKLIKYFLAALTIPERDLWVNLSPYEKNRIIPQSFGLTEMGRDLLAEDYMLKQITASLIYPEDKIGKKFWKRIYEEAAKKLGTTNIPVNTFNKVWIVPQKAVVYENAKAGTAYVVEAKFKVMLEQDYLALAKDQGQPGDSSDRQNCRQAGCQANEALEGQATQSSTVNALGSSVVRQIIIPELTKEVNEGKNFSHLRQVYNSLILAAWYKKKIKDSILEQVYANKNKIVGVGYTSTVIPAKAGIHAKNDVEGLYREYIKAFKKGVYNYIKEEADPVTQEVIPRKYFSGGVDFAMIDTGNTSLNINGGNGLEITEDSNKLPPAVADPQAIVEANVDPALANAAMSAVFPGHPDYYDLMGSSNERPFKAEDYRFTQQINVNRNLASQYTAPLSIIESMKEKASAATSIALINEEFKRLERNLDNKEKRALARKKEDLIAAIQNKTPDNQNLQNLFVLATAWVESLKEKYADTQRVYIARDGGFFHLIDDALEKMEPQGTQAGSSVYYLSRDRMSGGMRGIYQRMMNLTNAAVRDSKDNYDDFLRILKRSFKAAYSESPTFKKAVDSVYAELDKLGYTSMNKVVFVDTGFLGTIPFFLKNVLELDREDDPAHSGISVAVIQPSNIKSFAQQLFGLDLEIFTEQERGYIASLASIPLDEVGTHLEIVRAHPVGFDNTTFEIYHTSAVTQLEFFYEQAVAVNAVLAYKQKLAGAVDPQEKEKLKTAILRWSFNDYIKSLPNIDDVIKKDDLKDVFENPKFYDLGLKDVTKDKIFQAFKYDNPIKQINLKPIFDFKSEINPVDIFKDGLKENILNLNPDKNIINPDILFKGITDQMVINDDKFKIDLSKIKEYFLEFNISTRMAIVATTPTLPKFLFSRIAVPIKGDGVFSIEAQEKVHLFSVQTSGNIFVNDGTQAPFYIQKKKDGTLNVFVPERVLNRIMETVSYKKAFAVTLSFLLRFLRSQDTLVSMNALQLRAMTLGLDMKEVDRFYSFLRNTYLRDLKPIFIKQQKATRPVSYPKLDNPLDKAIKSQDNSMISRRALIAALVAAAVTDPLSQAFAWQNQKLPKVKHLAAVPVPKKVFANPPVFIQNELQFASRNGVEAAQNREQILNAQRQGYVTPFPTNYLNKPTDAVQIEVKGDVTYKMTYKEVWSNLREIIDKVNALHLNGRAHMVITSLMRTEEQQKEMLKTGDYIYATSRFTAHSGLPNPVTGAVITAFDFKIDPANPNKKEDIDTIDAFFGYLEQMQKGKDRVVLIKDEDEVTHVSFAFRVKVNPIETASRVDHAVIAETKQNKFKKGGIDLAVSNALTVQNNGQGIKFHLDPAMLTRLQNAPGFVPVIINIHPLDNLQKFLGVNAASE